MSRRLRTYAYAGLLAVLPAAGRTDDRWEAGHFRSDETSATVNESSTDRSNGATTCNIGGGIDDQDWMVLGAERHSYEARVSAGSTLWNTGTCLICPGFDRVTATVPSC